MASQSITHLESLLDTLLIAGDQGQSGLVAGSSDSPVVLRLVAGHIVELDGTSNDDAVLDTLSTLGRIRRHTVYRAVSTARIARSTPAHILEELNVLDTTALASTKEPEFAAGMLTLVRSDGPWEWRALNQAQESEEKVPLLPLLATVMAHFVDAKVLQQLGGRFQQMTFVTPDSPGAQYVPQQILDFLRTITPTSELKKLLTDGAVSPREALAWIVVALRLGWLENGSPNAYADQSQSEVRSHDDPEELTIILDDDIEGDQEDTAVEVELVDEDPVMLETVEESAVQDLDDLEAALDADGKADEDVLELSEEVNESVVEPLEEPEVIEDAPVVESAAEQAVERKRFYETEIPDSVYSCLGLPEGTAGQGVAQAYSKRFRRIQKLLEQEPGNQKYLDWREALLKAYRILNHSEATTLYDQLVAEQEGAAGVPEQVVRQMAKTSLHRGVQQLRSGDRFGGAKSLQEAVMWRADMAEAWTALGFYQASLEDEEDRQQALQSFSEAVQHAPDNGRIRYLRAVTAHFAGNQDLLAEDRAWFDAHRDAAPEVWDQFLQDVVAG